MQFSPQLSPNGDTVAYSWAGPADDNLDVYVKGLGLGARPLRLTEDPAQDWSPVWSPDGSQIAFVRDLEDGPAIFTVPWPSGQERLLTQLTGSIFECWDYYFVTTMSWSPDGDWLAYAEKPSEDEPARLVRLALATLEEQALTTPPTGTQGDFFPAFSPDGSQLAFVRTRSWWGNQDLWVQPAGGGEPRHLTFQGYTRLGAQLVWTLDGSEILFTVLYPRHTILRVSLAGAAPQPVAGLGEGAGLPSIRGRRMVYRQLTQYPQDIWRVPGRKASTPDREPERLIASSGADRNPDYSPDGRRIAFNSNRSGVLNVWVCDNDGSRPLQLTTHQKHSDTPRWSPDGGRILFNSNEAGVWDLYVVDSPAAHAGALRGRQWDLVP